MTATAAHGHDVVVMGGGLAGLTLALQLEQQFADIDGVVRAVLGERPTSVTGDSPREPMLFAPA